MLSEGDYLSNRFIFENQTMVSGTPREDGDDINVLLLRAPNVGHLYGRRWFHRSMDLTTQAAKLTAKDWGLKEGDKIYGVLCCESSCFLFDSGRMICVDRLSMRMLSWNLVLTGL